LQCVVAFGNTLQHTATLSATHWNDADLSVRPTGLSLCNTLQHMAKHCNPLQHTETHCNTRQRKATHCNTLQHSATQRNETDLSIRPIGMSVCNTLLQHTATQGNTLHMNLSARVSLACLCNTLPHTATHCNTTKRDRPVGQSALGRPWQHSTTHCNTLQHTATQGNTLQHVATHCNTLQHTTTHCNTLHHTATHCNTLQHNKTKQTCQSDCPDHAWVNQNSGIVSKVSYGISFIVLFCKRDLWNYRSLLQSIVSFIVLFCKRDLYCKRDLIMPEWTKILV